MHFSDLLEIDPKYASKPYYIEPDRKAEKAYVLLREALKKAKKVGIAKWVLRNKEHLTILRPEDKALELIELRFSTEIRSPKKLDLPEKASYSKQELDIALTLIKQLERHFDIKEYKDSYTEELMKIIDKKSKGEKIRVSKKQEPIATDMRNLMSILKQSLEQEKRKPKVKSR